MRKDLLIFACCVVFAVSCFAAAPLTLVEMEKSEPWETISDTDAVSVAWHTDGIAVLAVTEQGLEILKKRNIQITLVDEVLFSRDYYIVSSRHDSLPDGWSGNRLSSGHFLASVPAGTIVPGSRDFGYQHLQFKQRALSSMTPHTYTGYASKDYDPFIQSYVDQVSESYLQSLLETMVAFVTRYSYTDECVDAVNWAAAEFESWGYDTEQVPHTAGMAPNVIAWKYGSENPDTIWVVGGHFDSISNNDPNTFAPGADDNGTGSALTMCCADLLKDMNFADTVIYALWTGEEQGLYGSDYWAEWAANQGLNIQGYYNFDMIGWVDPSPEDLDVLVNSASQSFGQDFVDIADMYTDLLHDLQVENVTASDHYSFWQEGYSAFCAIEDYWPTYPYYHTDQDTVDKVDFPFFAEVTKAMVANICTAAQLSETVAIGQNQVTCDTLLDISVIDFDATGSITATVVSDTESTPEVITLNETTDHFFTGSIQLTDAAPFAGDGQLSVTHGDTVTVTSPGVTGDATATVDCEAPVISGVTVQAVTSQTATITFTTDETAHIQVRYGETSPTVEITGSGAQTNHTVILDGLNDCTHYVFEVEAADPAGNITIDSNGGAYYGFMTWERLSMLQVTMDSDPGWTCEGQWEYGIPQGNDGDPDSGYTGDNVIGYNLAGDYTNNMSETFCTTTAIDCSMASQVYFTYWKWLGVESASYDHAALEVSGDGGSSWTELWSHSGGSVSGGSWEFEEYDISAVAAGNNTVMIRWIMGETDSSVTYCGWNIDDVELFAEIPCTQPTATPSECIHDGDVNQDSEVTAGDAQMAFQIALGSYMPSYEEECAADCNGNEEVTAGDAQLIFMTALGSGTCID